MTHIADQKEHLRHSIEERLSRFSEKDRAAEGRTLCRQLKPHIPPGSVVCAYFPMRTEADIRPLLTELLARGDRVYLPCYEGKLVFRRLTEMNALQKGKLGTMEPPPEAEELKPGEAQYVLVPGRAFDSAGRRLGRGNGGYDIWIRRHRKAHGSTRFIGIALECQLVGAVPVEENDEPMDAVVTARGYREARPEA